MVAKGPQRIQTRRSPRLPDFVPLPHAIADSLCIEFVRGCLRRATVNNSDFAGVSGSSALQ